MYDQDKFINVCIIFGENKSIIHISLADVNLVSTNKLIHDPTNDT